MRVETAMYNSFEESTLKAIMHSIYFKFGVL